MTIDYYNRHSREFFSATKDIDVTPLYEHFLAHLPPNAYILDAGCGSGRDSKFFLEQGYRVFAMDGSAALAALAAEYIGQPVHHMAFADIGMADTFDGIWACASLLHVPRAQMATIFQKFIRALKMGGVWYLSFKWGTSDRLVNDRLFTDYDADTFSAFVAQFPTLKLVKWWQTQDLRGRETSWLNALLQKQP